jgi:ankyrin repeat protein
VNIQTKGGWTALHIASYNNLGEICHILIKHNANQSLKDKNGIKPLFWGYGFFNQKYHVHSKQDGSEHI